MHFEHYVFPGQALIDIYLIVRKMFLGSAGYRDRYLSQQVGFVIRDVSYNHGDEIHNLDLYLLLL